MELKLERPLIFFDLETTGTNITKDRIVELSYVKVYPDGHEETKSRRINPEMPIPPASTAVHHITDLEGRQFIDVQNIFHKMEQRTLVAAYRFYCGKELEGAHSAEADTVATYEVLKSQLDRYPELKNDVKALAEFSRGGRSLDLAGRIVLNDNDEPVFNFGKHKGSKVIDVFRREPSFYAWMVQGDFPKNTKDVVTRLYAESRKRKK